MKENDSPQVELAQEPKVEDRFGFNADHKVQSSRTIKFGILSTIIGLVVVCLTKTPSRPETAQPDIDLPDSSKLYENEPKINLSAYSESQDRARLLHTRYKRSSSLKLPGVQEIDRNLVNQIPPGSVTNAVLVTGASNGPVKARVTDPLEVQGDTLVPAGSTLLGVGQSTDDRLLVHFTKLVLSDGTFQNIEADAADPKDQTIGLRGSKISSEALKYGAAIGLNFVGGMADGLEQSQSMFGTTVTAPSAKNALLNGVSTATLDLANNTMSELQNRPTVIEVPSGKHILIMFSDN